MNIYKKVVRIYLVNLTNIHLHAKLQAFLIVFYSLYIIHYLYVFKKQCFNI